MRSIRSLVLPALVVAATASAALAQNPQFQKFREQHQYTFQLQTMLLNGIVECEKQKPTEIKPEQAKKLLAALTPLRSQPKLKQDTAKAKIQEIQKILT